MRQKTKKRVLLLGALIGLGCMTGALATTGWGDSQDRILADAQTDSTVEMMTGAAVRKDSTNPGIKFTASIENYSSSNQYGMLIIPAAALDKFSFNDDYISVLNREVGEGMYINQVCRPYTQNNEKYISLSITNILESNYSLDFVGIGYVYDGAKYTYADIDRADNVRSAAYVAQLALKYEENLTKAQESTLEAYFNPGILVEKDSYISGLGDESIDIYGDLAVYEEDKAASIDASKAVASGGQAFITKTAYSNITSISFDVKTGTGVDWWGLAFDADGADLNVYDTSRIIKSCSTNGEWWSVKYTILADGYCGARIFDTSGNEVKGYGGDYSLDTSSYYIYLVAGDANWTENVLIDNFKIVAGGVTYTDDFNVSATNGLFNSNGCATSEVLVSAGYEADGKGNVLSLDATKIAEKSSGKALITKTAYSNITSVSFDVKTGEGVDWWGLAFTASDGSPNMYDTSRIIKNCSTNGEWWSVKYTILADGYCGSRIFDTAGNEVTGYGKDATLDSSAYYIYFVSGTASWTENVLIDNFKIVAGGVTYTEDFNKGIEGSLFQTCPKAGVQSIERAEGKIDLAPLPAETVLAVSGGAVGGNEGAVFTSKSAYNNISEITFDAMATAEYAAAEGRWGLSFHSTANAYGSGYQCTIDGTKNTQLHLYKGDEGDTSLTNVWLTYKYVFDGSSIKVYYKTMGADDGEYSLIGTCSYETANKAYYVYLTVCPSTKMGGVGTIIKLDNFKIVADGETYTDKFTSLSDGLFTEDPQNVFSRTVLSLETQEDAEEVKPEYSLEYLLANGEISSVLLSGKPATIKGVEWGDTNLPASMLIAEGQLTYTLTQNSGIAVRLDDGAQPTFLYADRNVLAYYKGSQLLKSIPVAESDTYTLYLAVTAGGKISAKMNGSSYYGLTGVAPTCISFTLLNGKGVVKITDIAFDFYATSGIQTLIYSSNDQIDFTAYAPPTVENWGPGNGGNPDLLNDQQYQWLSEAGFTALLALYEGRNGDKYVGNDDGTTTLEEQTAKAAADAARALALAEKYGLTYYVNHEFYNGFARKDGYTSYDEATYRALYEEIFNDPAIQQLINSEAFGGFYLTDEPALPSGNFMSGYNYGELEVLDDAVRLYNEYVGAGKAIVNLLPYAGVNSTVRARYNKYIQYYAENIAPYLGYISFDYYPYLEDTDNLNETHLLNLEMVAKLAKENNLELRTYAYSLTEDDTTYNVRGTKSENELALQIYSALAFGSKDITYYMYTNHYRADDDSVAKSLIDMMTGEREEAWYWAKNVNNSVHAFEDAYLNFTWEGVMYQGSNSQFSLLENSKTVANTNHNRLTAISSSANVLVGYFSDADGKMGATDGFLVMNYGDPRDSAGASDITLTFNNATRLLVYQNGNRRVIDLVNGKATISLEVGQGVFAIPYNGGEIPNVNYTVEHYTENEDGSYSLYEKETFSAQAYTTATVTAKEISGYTLDEENEENVLSETVNISGNTVLKAYYRFVKNTVTFTVDGNTYTTSSVRSGSTVTAPETPVKTYHVFVEWQKDGVRFDFDTPITSDTELVAVFAENSRYAQVYIEDGSTFSKLKWAADNNGATATVSSATFEGDEVIAYTYPYNTSSQGDYLKIDCEGEAAALLTEASNKKYFGFSVYSPANGVEVETIFILSGINISGGAKYKFRLMNGWNEIIIDMDEYMALHNVTWDGTYPIYRFGVRATTVTFNEAMPSASEAVLYFDNFYATDYDMTVIDFESKGDMNRYTFVNRGSYGEGIDYANKKYSVSDSTGIEFVTVDGENVAKFYKTNSYIGLSLKQIGFIPKDLTGYTKMEIRFRLDTKANLNMSGIQDYATINDQSKVGTWETYTLDISSLSSASSIDFELWGAEYFYIDYIKFVK